MKTPRHQTGQKAKVEVYNYLIRECDFINCEIIKSVSALDRPYRVTVQTEDGRVFEECAPECVIPIN